MLADPVACPGGLEGLAAWLAWRLPDVPIATIVASLDWLAALVAAVAFALLATRLRLRPRAAILVALALAATLLSPPALAPTVAAATAAACLAWLAIIVPPATRRAALVARTAAFAVVACVTPRLVIPATVTAVIVLLPRRDDATTVASRDWPLALGAGAIVLAAGGLVAGLVPPTDSSVLACLMPFARGSTGPAPVLALGSALARIGLPILALAALGVFETWRSVGAAPRGRLAATIALVALPFLFAPGEASDAARVLSPSVVGLWLLAAAGSDALLGRLRTPGQQRVAYLFLLLVPLLQLARPAPPVPAEDRPLGHDAVTARWIDGLAADLPAGSMVVREDALTDLLWRGLDWSRGPVPAFVADEAEAVRRALASGDVFALPRARRHLEPRGLAASPTGVTGVARLTAGPPCVVAAGDWRPGPALESADGLAFVAPDPEARGPVVIYLASETGLRVYARDWPRGIERGFDRLTYDLASESDRGRLASDRRADGLPAAWAEDTPFMARVELWRIPGAPLALPVTVEGPVTTVLTRATGTADPSHPPRLCPSFVASVAPIGG